MPTITNKLKTYHRRRNTTTSHEPAGTKKTTHPQRAGKPPIFVIQKHAASHLHFDFRIEVDGVLKSWAVPKGISIDPADKRLAIPTDDHPYEYANFQGVIPPGNYGAGTVEIWDKGTYRNLKTMDGKPIPMSTCVKNGRIEIALQGKKLKGNYALMRTRMQGDKPQWLLFKMKDGNTGRGGNSGPQKEQQTKQITAISKNLSPRRRPGPRLDSNETTNQPPTHKHAKKALDPGLRRDDSNRPLLKPRLLPSTSSGQTVFKSVRVEPVETYERFQKKSNKKPTPHIGTPFVPTPESKSSLTDTTTTTHVNPTSLTIKLNTHTIELTHLDKILFHDPNITKGDLVAYYNKIAPGMLPYMHDRAVTMHRFPSGIDHEGFYQKEIGDYFPSWIKRAVLKKEGGSTTYVVCNNAATLVYLANQGCITPHLWLSHTDKPDYPDRLIFDLDPGKQTFAVVRKTALVIRDALAKQKLMSWVMTTGSKGLHVVVPLDRRTAFDDVRAYAHTLATRIAVADTKHLTIEVHIDKRRGRLFIDTSRNAYAQTTVAPYAVRALPGAPVATPLHWEELEDRRLTAQSYTIKNVFDHIKNGDPWKDISRHTFSLKLKKQ